MKPNEKAINHGDSIKNHHLIIKYLRKYVKIDIETTDFIEKFEKIEELSQENIEKSPILSEKIKSKAGEFYLQQEGLNKRLEEINSLYSDVTINSLNTLMENKSEIIPQEAYQQFKEFSLNPKRKKRILKIQEEKEDIDWLYKYITLERNSTQKS